MPLDGTQLVSSMNRTLRQFSATFSSAFEGLLGTNHKHDFRKDFGFPEELYFQQYYQMYDRNSLAAGAIDKTIEKTWQNQPRFLPEGAKTMGEAEKGLHRHLRKIRFFPVMQEADRRALVGGYSVVVMRIADGGNLDQPVAGANGIQDLVELIPLWASQIRVAKWDTDPNSNTYSKPLMYEMDETSLKTNDPKNVKPTFRKIYIHPDRIIVWSKDMTLNCQSALRPGFNDLITIEKIVGAGGEGFWKNAKSSLILEMDKEASPESMAAAMGLKDTNELNDAMNEQVEEWQRGFDVQLFLQGIAAKNLNVRLPSPQWFFAVALMSFCASFKIPQKILVGTQTGERASKEDALDWAYTNMQRRENFVVPNLEAILERFYAFGLVASDNLDVKWTDIAESSVSEKMDRVHKMADSNQKAGVVVFTVGDMRGVMDMETEGDFDSPGTKIDPSADPGRDLPGGTDDA